MSNKDTQPKPGDVKVIERGRCYQLPQFEVIPGEGLTSADDPFLIPFVRGSKDPNETISRQAGIVHESLLNMMIIDLQHKDRLVSCKENQEILKKLKEALMWMELRQRRREREGTKGTYQE